VYVGDAAVAVLAVGVEVRLAVVHVQEVVELLGHHRAPVLVAHLRRGDLPYVHTYCRTRPGRYAITLRTTSTYYNQQRSCGYANGYLYIFCVLIL
jgi:hypothetical protein